MANAKRSATSELNHDNWDDDVEPEDAGKFAQADDNTIKGRVIKKAKRRGLQSADGAPSVFAGFGGFKAAPSGGNSFDFLGKSSNVTTSTGFGNTTSGNGFVFGNPNSSTSSTVPASFSFGSKSATTTNGTENNTESEKKNADTDATETNGSTKTNLFQFGSSQNSTSTSIFGGATNKPFAIKSGPKENVFGTVDVIDKKENGFESQKDTLKTETQNQLNNLPPLNQLAAFKPSGGAKWTCSSCMVSNDADKSACVCCETLKPGGATKTKWTCDTCMVGNDAEKDKCVCCETPKPGLGPKKTESAALNPMGAIAPGGGFTFGVASSSAPSSSAPTSGFTFGTSSSNSTQSQGFKFGMESTSSKAVTGISGANTSTRDTTRKDTLMEKQVTDNNTISTEKLTVVSDRVSDEEVKRVASNSKEFLSHLSALNKQFFEWIDKHLKKNPYILISPCIRDYEKHLAQLTKEYADKKDEVKENINRTAKDAEKEDTPIIKSVEKIPAPKGLLSGIFGNPSGTTKPETANFTFGNGSQPFTFGQEKKKDSTAGSESSSTTSASGGFSFGNQSGAASSGFSFGGSSAVGSTFGSGSMFGQAAAAAIQAKKESDNAETEENEDDQPPKVEVKQVIEDDAIHSVRCKLFYKKDKEFAEKGLGMLYLKKVDAHEEEGNAKTQLLVRADTNLGNILLNILLNKQMNLVKRNNCIQFVCIPNPEIPGVTAGSPVSMLVKVKNADQANILEDELKKRINMI